MAMTGAYGRKLEISVLTWRDTSASIHGQKLLVVVRYGDKSCSTKTRKGRGADASFQENFKFEFIDGQHEIDIAVWKKNFWRKDRLVAFRKIDLDAQVFGGQKIRKKWLLQYQPKHGADVKNVGEAYLEITCPVIQPNNFQPPPPSAPYGYPCNG